MDETQPLVITKNGNVYGGASLLIAIYVNVGLSGI